MGKNKVLNRHFLCLILVLNTTLLYSQLAPVQKVVQTYSSEIGVREATGRNDGVRVVEYLRAANRKQGDAWCAAFVTWTFKQSGVKAVVSGWSPSWFTRNVIYTRGKAGNKLPQQADVFGLYFSKLGRIGHVGFIDNWPDGESKCITVEGNTNEAGSREGDGVYRKRRLKSQIYKVSRWL